ncbi:hypothetical protein HK102_002336 [Quaeritorhiza haematococci]|nr:hypothetical protein HK102_002336 [Quaeritorhiza haematococci]
MNVFGTTVTTSSPATLYSSVDMDAFAIPTTTTLLGAPLHSEIPMDHQLVQGIVPFPPYSTQKPLQDPSLQVRPDSIASPLSCSSVTLSPSPSPHSSPLLSELAVEVCSASLTSLLVSSFNPQTSTAPVDPFLSMPGSMQSMSVAATPFSGMPTGSVSMNAGASLSAGSIPLDLSTGGLLPTPQQLQLPEMNLAPSISHSISDIYHSHQTPLSAPVVSHALHTSLPTAPAPSPSTTQLPIPPPQVQYHKKGRARSYSFDEMLLRELSVQNLLASTSNPSNLGGGQTSSFGASFPLPAARSPSLPGLLDGSSLPSTKPLISNTTTNTTGGSSSTSSSSIRKPTRQQKPQRMFPCTRPGCEKSYYTSSGLRYHMTTFDHKMEGEPPVNRRKFPCTVRGCSRFYYSGAGLRYHLEIHHQISNENMDLSASAAVANSIPKVPSAAPVVNVPGVPAGGLSGMNTTVPHTTTTQHAQQVQQVQQAPPPPPQHQP